MYVQNLTDVRIPWTPRRTVHVVGHAAMQPPKRGTRVQGVLVQRAQHGTPCVMQPPDLGLYNKVGIGRLVQRQVMQLRVEFSKCRLALEMVFDGIDGAQALGGLDGFSGDGTSLPFCRLLLPSGCRKQDARTLGVLSTTSAIEQFSANTLQTGKVAHPQRERAPAETRVHMCSDAG